MILIDESRLSWETRRMVLQDCGVIDSMLLTDEEVEQELDRFRTFRGQRAKCKLLGDGLSDTFIKFLEENDYFR